MHWGHVSKTEMIWSSDPVSWMNKSRNDNKIDLHWRLCASVHLCVHTQVRVWKSWKPQTKTTVTCFKEENYLTQEPQVFCLELWIKVSTATGRHSDINHSVQNASSSEALLTETGEGPDLAPAPSCVLPSYPEGTQTNKCIHRGSGMGRVGQGG